MTEYQVYIFEMFIYNKNHVTFDRMIKSALFKVCSIAYYIFFPSFGGFMNTTPVKLYAL